jgi:uncharacterized protein (TIGR03083 family)
MSGAEQMRVADLTATIRLTSGQLERLLAQLTVEQMNRPGAVGVWSVKDVLAHLAYWQRYAAELAACALSGETPDLEGDDATERSNASVVAQYYQRPLASVIADWQAAREDLLDQLEELSDEDLTDPERFTWNGGRTLLDRIMGNSFEHELEHIEQLREWLQAVKS